MHAVVVAVDIEGGKLEQATQMLNSVVVPAVSQSPGFVSGVWVHSVDGAHGQSIMVYENEETAKAAAAALEADGPPPGAPVKLVSVNVFEVAAQV